MTAWAQVLTEFGVNVSACSSEANPVLPRERPALADPQTSDGTRSFSLKALKSLRKLRIQLLQKRKKAFEGFNLNISECKRVLNVLGFFFS